MVHLCYFVHTFISAHRKPAMRKCLFLFFCPLISFKTYAIDLADFSKADSHEKMEQLEKEGQLVKILMVPPAFGGKKTPKNMIYVPNNKKLIKKLKRKFKQGFKKIQGTKKRFTWDFEYKDKSHVPYRIKFEVLNTQYFNETVQLWK